MIMQTLIVCSQKQQNDNEKRRKRFAQKLKSENILKTTTSPTPKQRHKLFLTTRNWSLRTQSQRKYERKGNKSHLHTARILDENDQESEENQKSLQIIIRQSLRRAQMIRQKNKQKLTEMNENGSWWRHSGKKVLSSQNQTTIETFAELEGKKCKINSPVKSFTPQSKYRRSKSSQAKHQKKPQKQLSILQQQQQKKSSHKEMPVEALGLASKKILSKSPQPKQYYIIETNHNNINKIALSTANCFILGADNMEKSNTYNFGNQNNFIRVKKKAKQLMKKVNNFENQSPEKEQNLLEPQIQSFVMDSMKNSSCYHEAIQPTGHRKCSFRHEIKPKKIQTIRNSQNPRLSGWEVSRSWQAESGF